MFGRFCIVLHVACILCILCIFSKFCINVFYTLLLISNWRWQGSVIHNYYQKVVIFPNSNFPSSNARRWVFLWSSIRLNFIILVSKFEFIISKFFIRRYYPSREWSRVSGSIDTTRNSGADSWKTGTPLYRTSSCCTCSYLTVACSDDPDVSRVPTNALFKMLSKLLVPDSIGRYPRGSPSHVQNNDISRRHLQTYRSKDSKKIVSISPQTLDEQIAAHLSTPENKSSHISRLYRTGHVSRDTVTSFRNV